MITQKSRYSEIASEKGFFIVSNSLDTANQELDGWCEENKDKWIYVSVSPQVKNEEEMKAIKEWTVEVSFYPKKPFHIMLGWYLYQKGSEGLVEVPTGEDISKLMTTYAMLGHFWQAGHRESDNEREPTPPKPKKKEPTNMEIAMRKAGLID